MEKLTLTAHANNTSELQLQDELGKRYSLLPGESKTLYYYDVWEEIAYRSGQVIFNTPEIINVAYYGDNIIEILYGREDTV